MKEILVTLSLSAETASELHPLLLEHLPASQIRHIGLFAGMSLSAIEQQFAAAPGDPVLSVQLDEGCYFNLCRSRLTQRIQAKIHQLEAEGAETILLLCHSEALTLHASAATVLEPDRLVPPLVETIVAGHQVGIVLSHPGRLSQQQYKWRNLSTPPCFAVASPWQSGDEALTDAALLLQDQGADVVLLDCFGYHAQHRDFIQKLLGIPVVLSNALLVQLAAELVM